MSGILYLNSEDFAIKKGEKGNLMCLNYDVQGLSLVLFYSNECQHCNKLLVKYKQLPFNINGCQFTMINVNKMENRKVVQMSNQTIVPITFVPDIILYVDGIPYMRYDGSHDINQLKRFILEIYQQLQKTAFISKKMSRPSSQQQQQQQNTNQPPTNTKMQNGMQQQNVNENNPKSSIPAYTIGRPKCTGDRDDICYLSFNQAYDNGAPGVPSPSNHGGLEQSRNTFYNNRG